MGIIGFTSKLEYDSGGGTFTAVSETTTITIPAMEVTSVETSHLGISASAPYKTFTPGLIDAGVLAFECNYSSTVYSALHGLRGKLKATTIIPPTGGDVRWRVTAPDEDGSGSGTAQTFTWNGFLTKCEVNVGVEDVMKIKGEVKLSGAPTIA